MSERAQRTDRTLGRTLGMTLVWLISLSVAAFFWRYINKGVDAKAYWLAARHTHLYTKDPGKIDAYLYSPAFSTFIWPLAQLPRAAFVVVWMVAEAAAFAWLLKPLGIRWGVPAFCLCQCEVAIGNIYAFLALVAVFGLRRPMLWVVPALTKITPTLGPVWFAVRKEWRGLSLSLVAIAVVAATSFAVTPHQWSDWVHFLLDHKHQNQALLPLRVAGALVLTAFAARTNRTWLLVVAMLVANPMVYRSYFALTLLAGIPRIVERQRQRQVEAS